MALITESGPETLSIGSPAPDFNLPGTDGNTYSLASFSSAKAIVLAFTCNHCPYAKAYDDRFQDLFRQFGPQDVAFAAISANDAENYPEDSFENMKQRDLPFPYLYDESQETAKAYGAVCTPHYFVLDGERKVVYEGRLDDNWQQPNQVQETDLKNAIEAVLAGEKVPAPNTNPMGCSIKWK